MCSRYAITSSPETIRQLFGYRAEAAFPPRYNVAPTQPVPVVRCAHGEPEFILMRWGLIPPWVKDPSSFSLIVNARGESVNEKPAFRNAMKRRRCLLPADGFYEWKAETGPSRPYFVRRKDGRPLALAGLWETWMGPDGEEMDTVCVITTRANGPVASIHERMPVIIELEAFSLWLDCEHVDELGAAALIAPAPEHLLEAYEVSLAVNRTANDSAALIEQVARANRSGEEIDDAQASLFP